MRDLVAYPVTQAEKIAVMREIYNETVEKNYEEVICGDMRAIILAEIIADLYKATATEEGIVRDQP